MGRGEEDGKKMQKRGKRIGRRVKERGKIGKNVCTLKLSLFGIN